jgi:hypothetical protein
MKSTKAEIREYKIQAQESCAYRLIMESRGAKSTDTMEDIITEKRVRFTFREPRRSWFDKDLKAAVKRNLGKPKVDESIRREAERRGAALLMAKGFPGPSDTFH